MRFVSLACLIALSALTTGAAPDYTLKTQTPLAVIFAAPTGKLAHTTRSDLLRDLEDVIRAHTNLKIQTLDPQAMQQCRGRLTCLVLRARTDFDPNQGDSYRQHVARLVNRGIPYPEYLLVLTAVATGPADRWSAALVSTDLALQKISSMSDRSDEAAIESIVTETAIAASRDRVEVSDPKATKAFLDSLVQNTFQATFRRAGYWEPYGELAVQDAPEGITLSIDGTTIGLTKPGQTVVGGLLPGEHTVVLEHPGYMVYTAKVDVDRKQQATLQAQLIKKANPISSATHKIVFWSGVAAAVAGVSLLAYSATQGSDVSSVCIGGESQGCTAGSDFVRTGFDPDSTNALELNNSGVPIAPLGYSLAGAGAAWGVGSLLTPDSDAPWIAGLAGLIIGGLSYGISVAVD